MRRQGLLEKPQISTSNALLEEF